MIKFHSILLIAILMCSSVFSSKNFLKLSKAKTSRVFKLTLINRDNGEKQIVECEQDKYILECAEEDGMDLPFAARVGNDYASVGKLISGTVDQSEQSILNQDEIEAGYFLYDVAYPTSDLIMEYNLRYFYG